MIHGIFLIEGYWVLWVLSEPNCQSLIRRSPASTGVISGSKRDLKIKGLGIRV